MGEAKRKGTFEQRKELAIKEGRDKTLKVLPKGSMNRLVKRLTVERILGLSVKTVIDPK